MKAAAKDPTVRVRFAPSPTGLFHVGSARTALFNWLFARKRNGAFVLRIEDTDKERSRREYEREIADSLTWLGLDWDEGPDKGGSYAPYRQSERTALYRKHLEQLLREEKAYYCYCTKEELEAERQAMAGQGLPPKYSGHCRNAAAPPEGKAAETIRFKMPETRVEFHDLIRGRTTFDAELFGDVVIAKDLDTPLYNFAVVVDDELMTITHVIRGEDHFSNTPKQILFQRALGFREPAYAHLPLILAPDRSKLSKRYAETSLLNYREEGYLPESVINFIALLGWHPRGDDREVLSREELVEEFDVSRVQKAGAVFNQEKLAWLNQQYLKKLSDEEIVDRLTPFLKKKEIVADEELVKKAVHVERERAKTLNDILELGDFFFVLPDYDPELLVWKGDSPQETKTVLQQSLEKLEWLPDTSFKKESILGVLNDIIEGSGGRGSVLWPLRVALSGKPASPDPLDIAEVLGKEETLKRLKTALHKINAIT